MLVLAILLVLITTAASLSYPDVEVPQEEYIRGWWRIEETQKSLTSKNQVKSWKSDGGYNNSGHVEEIKSIWNNQFLPLLDTNVTHVYDTVQDKYVKRGLLPVWPASVGFGGLQVGDFEGRLSVHSTIAYVLKLKDLMLDKNQSYPHIELVFGSNQGIIIKLNVENNYLGFEWLCYNDDDTEAQQQFCLEGTSKSFQVRSWPRIKLQEDEETIVMVVSTSIYEQDEQEFEEDDPTKLYNGCLYVRTTFGSYESIWMQQDMWTIGNATSVEVSGIGYVWGTSSNDLKYSSPTNQLAVELFEVIYYDSAITDVEMHTLVKYLQQKYNRDDREVDFEQQVQQILESSMKKEEDEEEVNDVLIMSLGSLVGFGLIIGIYVYDMIYKTQQISPQEEDGSTPHIDDKFRLRTMSSMLLPSFTNRFRSQSSSKVFPEDNEDYRCLPTPKKVRYYIQQDTVTDVPIQVRPKDTAQED